MNKIVDLNIYRMAKMLSEIDVNCDELSKALYEVASNPETNPINLGVSIGEFPLLDGSHNAKTNGFLKGKKMGKILGRSNY